MKKLFLVMAIAEAFAACNSSTDKKETTDTTTVVPVDTATVPPVDTLKVDTSAAK